MTPSNIIARIHVLCQEDENDFIGKTEILYRELDELHDSDILTHIEEGGMIPEDIQHDSSEEKLFAKYCDYLLARGLTLIGILSNPIAERADAADVQGKGKVGQREYTIIGDAKAFRLSRTAKNQKDFKVDALNRWKKGANYAVLLSPLYQYPTRKSQIYHQAIERTVTLLSFSHLGFLINHKDTIEHSRLEKLWHEYNSLDTSQNAAPYWARIDELVCEAVEQPKGVLVTYLNNVLGKVYRRAEEQLSHWEKRKQEIEEMSIEQLRTRLIQAERIKNNIATISAFISTLERATSLNTEIGQLGLEN